MLVIKIAFKTLDDSGAKQEPNYTNTTILIYKIAKNKCSFTSLLNLICVNGISTRSWVI